jgi:ABC-type antimicrobial peptide transport system permease subunit
LEERLSDFGFDVIPARERLAALLAVQNTYLATFQSLGALGLTLGTLGLAAVQLRSVQQRRGELALLRAAGFGRRRITALVLYEMTTLMVAGLSLGAAAALLAVGPQLWSGAASFPWLPLLEMLLAVIVCGVAAGTFAALAAVRAPLIAALRGA